MKENQVKDAAFSFKFADEGSELTIGGTNADLFSGDFTDVPVAPKVHPDLTILSAFS